MRQEREREISEQSTADEIVFESTEDASTNSPSMVPATDELTDTLSMAPATDVSTSSLSMVPAIDKITLPEGVMALQTQVRKPLVMVAIEILKSNVC